MTPPKRRQPVRRLPGKTSPAVPRAACRRLFVRREESRSTLCPMDRVPLSVLFTFLSLAACAQEIEFGTDGDTTSAGGNGGADEGGGGNGGGDEGAGGEVGV